MKRVSAAVAALVLVGLAGCATEKGRDLPVFFDEGQSDLTPDGSGTVANIAKLAGKTGASTITVSGQADGGTPHDAELAYRRGEVVVQALEQAGIDARRIQLQPSVPPEGEHGVAAHKVVVHLES
jgi:outer membrane protein OmpA-like peptidoglycan-associated protein